MIREENEFLSKKENLNKYKNIEKDEYIIELENFEDIN